jgi:colanic acid/amylovoran biosynthesis glycosyltransferase
MKIAFIVSSFPATTETFITNQIVDLIDRGHEVKIFAFNKNEKAIYHKKILDYNLLEKTIFFQEFQVPKWKRYFPFLKFLIQEFQDIDFSKLINSFKFEQLNLNSFNLRFFYKYWWLLKSGDFDIIHAHFGPNGVYIAELKSMGFKKLSKLVTSFHGYDLIPSRLSHYKQDYENLFKQVDLMTVNTDYTHDLLTKITSFKQIAILPVGLDTSLFKKKNISCTEEFRILFVGRLINFKAPIHVLEIYSRLFKKGHENIGLTIIGDGALKGVLNKIVRDNNLKNVRLLGSLSQEEIVKEMELAHVFLLPGIYDSTGRAETQGLVLQEAQAMELPVIVSNVGGMKYGLKDGETGYVLKEKDLDSFVEKIIHLIENPELRIKMGKAGKTFVQQNYDSHILGDKLENYYHQILKSS